MGKVANPFQGVNRACAQCQRDCKQYENVVLVSCRLFTSRRIEPPRTNSYKKRSRMQKSGGEDG